MIRHARYGEIIRRQRRFERTEEMRKKGELAGDLADTTEIKPKIEAPKTSEAPEGNTPVNARQEDSVGTQLNPKGAADFAIDRGTGGSPAESTAVSKKNWLERTWDNFWGSAKEKAGGVWRATKEGAGKAWRGTKESAGKLTKASKEGAGKFVRGFTESSFVKGTLNNLDRLDIIGAQTSLLLRHNGIWGIAALVAAEFFGISGIFGATGEVIVSGTSLYIDSALPVVNNALSGASWVTADAETIAGVSEGIVGFSLFAAAGGLVGWAARSLGPDSILRKSGKLREDIKKKRGNIMRRKGELAAKKAKK